MYVGWESVWFLDLVSDCCLGLITLWLSTPFRGGQKNHTPLALYVRGIESSVLCPASISFSLTAR